MSQPPVLLPPVAAQLARRARRRCAVALLHLATALARHSTRVSAFTTGFVPHAIDRSDRGAMTATIYDLRAAKRAGAFYWERPWLERELPAPPAHVLVGGAGYGREAQWLVERGYTVVAFDPAAACVERHNALLPASPSIVLDYETLARASYARRSGSSRELVDAAAPVLERAPYDAALLGWGSLSHVIEEHEQDALFEALAQLVPQGPILASFFIRTPATDAAILQGRAYELGVRVGRAVHRDSHIEQDAPDSPGPPQFMPHCGFVYHFDRARLDQLAAIAGREIELRSDNTYPHATFRKR